MHFRLASDARARRLSLCAAAIGLVIGAAHDAHAQAALDDDDASPPPETASVSSGAAEPETLIGVGLRLRNVFVPEGLVEIFVDDAPGGSSEFGIGLEVTRRKGNFEFAFGLETESIFIEGGRWIERDKPPPAYEVDNVRFESFRWYTADVTFLNHTPFGRYFALRYGGGAGIGLLTGKVRHDDEMCATSSLNSCHPYAGGAMNKPYNLPPVFPVINAIFGGQIRPVENLVINIELGIRTLPFIGTTVGYYF